MNVELKIIAKNDSTALPRVLRIVDRQGVSLKKLVLQPNEDVLEIDLIVGCPQGPFRLVKLLKKQILVFDVQAFQDNVCMAV